MNFRVGQKVVCVNGAVRDGCAPWEECERIVEGDTYTIRSIHAYEAQVVVWLFERERCEGAKAHYGPRVGYCHSRFRPVVEKKTDISIFTEMLKPKQRELAQ